MASETIFFVVHRKLKPVKWNFTSKIDVSRQRKIKKKLNKMTSSECSWNFTAKVNMEEKIGEWIKDICFVRNLLLLLYDDIKSRHSHIIRCHLESCFNFFTISVERWQCSQFFLWQHLQCSFVHKHTSYGLSLWC